MRLDRGAPCLFDRSRYDTQRGMLRAIFIVTFLSSYSPTSNSDPQIRGKVPTYMAGQSALRAVGSLLERVYD